MPRLWDISPPISPATPAFPGDTAYQQRWAAEIGPGCPVNVSAITMSPHLGAHADAPLHYGKHAPAIGAVDLDPFIGRCRVIHAIDKAPLITASHLEHAQIVSQQLLMAVEGLAVRGIDRLRINPDELHAL